MTLDRLRLPIVQAPMAGVSSPAMAAAASEAGGLGSIGVGAGNAAAAKIAIDELRLRMSGPFNVNLFAHAPARPNPTREAAWIERLRPAFARFDATPPARLTEIYRSFVEDDEMLALLLAEKPAVVSLHFGAPAARMAALREAGITLFVTATNLAEARAAAAAGAHAIVAQGYEAGGHRGVFDPQAPDERLGALDLTREIVAALPIPVIAAGGLMSGADIDAALDAGAAAAQLGTAFVACDESLADEGYRAALFSDAAGRTVMTSAISGRPARCLGNAFTALDVAGADTPDYPVAYDVGKALNAAAKARGEFGFGAQWAGQGAPRARAMATAALMRTLASEMRRT